MAPHIAKTVAPAMAATEVALAALIIGLFAWLLSCISGVRADMRDRGRRLEGRPLAVDARLRGLRKGLGLAATMRAERPDSKPPDGVRMEVCADPPPRWRYAESDAAAPAPGRTIAASSHA